MDRLLKNAMTSRMTQPMDHPDAEQLAAWADGAIYGADAEGIESHLADCERCQAVIAAFVATDPAPAMASVTPIEAAGRIEPAPSVRVAEPARRAPYVLWAGAAAAALLVWFVWPKPAQTPVERSTIARNTEPRPSPADAAAAPIQGQTGAVTTPAPTQTPVIGAAPRQTIAAEKSAPTVTKPVSTSAAQTAVVSKPVAQPVTTAAAPPPPPAIPPADLIRTAPQARVTGAADVGLGQTSRSESNTLSYLVALEGGGVEFGPIDPVASVTLAPTRAGTAPARTNPLKAIRWRVMLSGIVEKTMDSGATWKRIVIDPALGITTGASPSEVVCWLAGKAGNVLRSTDGGATFVRVKTPVTADLVSINAADARTATVATSDGRRLTTTDGGQTWRIE